VTTTDEIRTAFDAQSDAVVFADLGALDALLSDGFTLTHLGGTVQSKTAWLTEIDAASMEYHRIDVVETATEVRDDWAVLTVRTLTDATIRGGRATWRLQLRLDYERRDGAWIARRSVASTW
jgi:Domain of unknown function (DUF4440)